MKNIFIILAIIFITSCVDNHLEIAQKTSKIAAKHGFIEKIYQTKNFKIFTLQKITQGKNLRIYFEGDGRAFINRTTISSNPTPTSYFLVNLMMQDPTKNIIYIARPCQFVDDEKCQQEYWSNARFAEEILTSVNEVVENFSHFKLELIAYSGGAEIAKYVAAKNNNIINFRTIAGNLDHKKFTEIHQVSPLDKSVDNTFLKLENIPQIHFVGSKDKVVSIAIANSYQEKLSDKSCIEIIKVAEANHSKGWQEKWSQLLEIKPICKK